MLENERTQQHIDDFNNDRGACMGEKRNCRYPECPRPKDMYTRRTKPYL